MRSAGDVRRRAMPFRIERDPLGEVRVPADAYYGVQTQRAVENFPISGLTAPPELVTATVLDQEGGGRGQRRRSAGSTDDRRRHRRGRRRDPRRRAARPVRRRRLPGRRRHVAQHERQRGAGQSRRRDPRRAARRLRARAPERSRQHGPVDQRRVPDRDAPRAAGRCCPDLLAAARELADGLAAKSREFARRPQDRADAPAGCRADHARPGVRRLRRQRRARGDGARAAARSSCSS